MGFWEWLRSMFEPKEVASRAKRLPPASAAPPEPPPSSPQAEMTNIRVTAPSLVRPVYGIQTAIELMRSLPLDENPDLVLRVVRKTLNSTGVEVEDTIASARTQEKELADGIAADRVAIQTLEEQIAVRKANIERLSAELTETRNVRQRLEEAMEGVTKVGAGALTPEAIAKVRAEAGVAPPPPAISKKPPPKLPSFPPAKRSGAPPAPSASPARPLATSIPDIEDIDDGYDEENIHEEKTKS